ncbi:MAG: imidazole glycerol phosphate synthase subunit HisH [Gammaproteobacteria bacterium]|nr:imidazole glycerol phosphate synthase subunit HisH [Gammaproteobacteria bacterium]
MSSIGVIDYGMGNLHSLAKALERVAGNLRVEVSPDPVKLAKCNRLVLPGVGGVRACMNELRRLELAQFVVEAARKVPLLGVCLGMQVLFERSQENEGVDALGLLPGSVVRFPDPPPAAPPPRLKVPHVGWNRVVQTQPHPLWEAVADGSWFYFVHSYYAAPRLPRHTLGEAEYGRRFAAVIGRDNVVGVQFHPEKSQAAGLQLLANFVAWQP